MGNLVCLVGIERLLGVKIDRSVNARFSSYIRTSVYRASLTEANMSALSDSSETSHSSSR
jgi:hypothetical protein